MPQDPMAMTRAMQAIMGQAGAWLTAYRADLAGRGLGFTPVDLEAVATAAAAHPLPPGHDPQHPTPTPAETADMKRVQQLARDAVYPEQGFAPDDPRLAPQGMSLVAYAVAARAVGWAAEDAALVDLVLAALGQTRADWDLASEHWTALLRTDMAVATLYGQLYAQCAQLPARP